MPCLKKKKRQTDKVHLTQNKKNLRVLQNH